MRLLLAEDEADLSRALETILKHAHYTVDVVDNGIDAYDYASLADYDGLLLDIMMPGMDGMEVLKKLRADGNFVPALFLTAKSGTEDKIAGLDLGADDYIAKPFDMGELLARIRAMTRRKEGQAAASLCFGDLTLLRASFQLRTDETHVTHLSGKESQMMELLMASPPRVVSTEHFMEQIWSDMEADDSVVWVNISNLRKKLASIGSAVQIKTKRGAGYYLEA